MHKGFFPSMLSGTLKEQHPVHVERILTIYNCAHRSFIPTLKLKRVGWEYGRLPLIPLLLTIHVQLPRYLCESEVCG